jgi:hypothetical protein
MYVEDELLQRKKAILSNEEKAFLCDRFVSENKCIQNEKLLLKYAPKIFPRHYKSMASKDALLMRESAKNLSEDWEDTLKRGKISLKEHVSKYLEKNMQSSHFTINQTVINMNKLAG